ncbi:hypothetical protein ACSFA0_25055 [Variovorax sp. LT1P1]|uniref:hypothetical protein n=1 Tax=Variovorax sp. LT1P1 TaxID=3443730 RepID=UPI003F483374
MNTRTRPQGPRTAAERTMALAGMTVGALRETISHHSSMPDVDSPGWLLDAVNEGFMSVSSMLDPAYSKDDLSAALDRRARLLDVYLQGLSRQNTRIADAGPPARAVEIVASAEFAQTYAQLVVATIRDDEELDTLMLDHGDHERDHAFAMLMVMGSALDMPECVLALGKRRPLAMKLPLELSTVMGEQGARCQPLARAGSRPAHLSARPFFFAMYFSSTACMRAFVEAGFDAREPIAFSAVGSGGGPYDALTVWSACRAHIETHAMALGLELGGQTAPFACPESLREAMIASLAPGIHDHLRAHIPTFLRAGFLDSMPAQAVTAACLHGADDVLEHFKGQMPWGRLVGDEQPDAAFLANCANTSFRPAETERRLLELIANARQDGTEAMAGILTPYIDDETADGGQFVVEPAYSLVRAGMTGVLVELMQAGLAPMKRLDDRALTLLEMAEAEGSVDTLAAVRSYQARLVASAALARAECEIPCL